MHYQKTQLTFMSDSIIVASNHTNYKSIAGCVSQQNHVIVNKFFLYLILFCNVRTTKM